MLVVVAMSFAVVMTPFVMVAMGARARGTRRTAVVISMSARAHDFSLFPLADILIFNEHLGRWGEGLTSVTVR